MQAEARADHSGYKEDLRDPRDRLANYVAQFKAEVDSAAARKRPAQRSLAVVIEELRKLTDGPKNTPVLRRFRAAGN